MLEELAKHYNDGLPANEHITAADVPGLALYVRRPDTGKIIK
jgi:hypothetical protein